MLEANTHKEEETILDNAKKKVQKAWIQRLDSANKDDEAAKARLRAHEEIDNAATEMALAALKVVTIAINQVTSDSTVHSEWNHAKLALDGAIDKVNITKSKRDIVKEQNKGRVNAWYAEMESENAMWAAEEKAWQAYQRTNNSTTLNEDIKITAFHAWEITREAARATIMTQRRPSTYQAKQQTQQIQQG
jgi:FAD/FMN-containing dehydrogenase